MHRIDGAGHVDHLFVAEDPATLRPPTEITPEIMNAFQEELATFIEWAGVVLAKGDNTQLKQALLAKFAGIDIAATKAGVQGQTYTAFTTTGATGGFILTPNPAIAAYAPGQRFRVKFHQAGNGADTINVSGLGAKRIKQYDSAGAKVAPVIALNQLVDVEFDGVDMVLLDPLPVPDKTVNAGGTADAITAIYFPFVAAVSNGLTLYVRPSAANATTTPTFAPNGLAAKTIVKGAGSALAVGDIAGAGHWLALQYDSTLDKWVLLNPATGVATATIKQIQPVSASVAANALTLTLNSTSLDFRSSNLASGAVNTRSVPAAISVVVPNTATLGTINAQASRLALIAIDNAGTVELAVVNMAGGNNLDETTLISTTAISAAATANNVIYSTTARANVPFRVVGFVDVTEAVAGTWATAPSAIQGEGGQALAAMSSLGYGQTWQNVSRSLNTTYYNTTGKPITVLINNASGSTNTTPTVGGVTLPTNYNYAWTMFVVPPGMSYSVASTASGQFWAELR